MSPPAALTKSDSQSVSHWAESLSTTKLPDGRTVWQINQHETDFLYGEIFRDEIYFRDGVDLSPDAVVFDVGANIGLFSVAVRERCPKSTVFAFEPSPAAAEALRRNTADGGVHVYECGVSSKIGSSTLTFYPGYSILSGFHADATADRAVLKEGIRDQARLQGKSQALSETALEWLSQQKLGEAVPVVCSMRTLSSVINEHQLDRIDLLKIDAEKCEEEILDGLSAQHWPLIRQIVMEVHDSKGETLDGIVSCLKGHGFQIRCQAAGGEDSSAGLYDVTAIRA
jgi:FkbM family methyltransferase